MKISPNTNNLNNNTPVNFKGIYNNKILLKGLKFAANNGTLFSATTTLALSVTARPIAIMATPKTDKENKKLAAAKSFASGIVNYLIVLCASLPVVNAVKKIDKNPAQFLNPKTIKNLKGSAKNLASSKKYSFASQLFKLGLGLLIAIPKSYLTCALIPPVMSVIFPKKKNKIQNHSDSKQQGKIISFKGLYDRAATGIAKRIGKIMDTKILQKAASKLYDTNFAQHIISLTDVVLTMSFVERTVKSKKIEETRKKPLIYNSIISTALCLSGGYAVNDLTNIPTEKFIKKFKQVNKDLPELEKYLEGIKVAKPVLILAGIYYIFIPLISTFLADRTDNKSYNKL